MPCVTPVNRFTDLQKSPWSWWMTVRDRAVYPECLPCSRAFNRWNIRTLPLTLSRLSPVYTEAMADQTPRQETPRQEKQEAPPSEAAFARRIVDPLQEASLSREQVYFIRQVELAQWKKKSQTLRGRNVATGLFIGAIVMGIYGYTFYSVSQERIMDDLDEQAKVARASGPKTGAN